MNENIWLTSEGTNRLWFGASSARIVQVSSWYEGVERMTAGLTKHSSIWV
jgi:hypothetical protein